MVDTVDCMMVFLQEYNEQLFRRDKRRTEPKYTVEYTVSLKQRLRTPWTTVIPLVRKVYSNIVAKDIVSVQLMSMPTGLTFTIDYANPQTTDRSTRSVHATVL
jgi:hypothetical protein